MAKHSKAKHAGEKPAAKVVNVKVDKNRVNKVDRVEVDTLKIEKKCLGCSAERTERIKYRTAIIALVAGILSLVAGLLLFGRTVVEARKQQTPPAAPLQIMQCAPTINVSVPAPRILQVTK